MISADSAITVIIIIIVELMVMLSFFRKEWLQAVHFTVAVNLVTFALAYMLIKYALPTSLDVPLMAVKIFMEVLMASLEAVLIYFFWDVSLRKAFLVSFLANLASFSVFQLLNLLNISPQNFLLDQSV